jgi:hypothetical protein
MQQPRKIQKVLRVLPYYQNSAAFVAIAETVCGLCIRPFAEIMGFNARQSVQGREEQV